MNTTSEISKIIVGIIGGTGLDQDSGLLKEAREVPVPQSNYGTPSDSTVLVGTISNTQVVVMSRHGKNHDINPSNVNYRANIDVLKKMGCQIILATTACGSLKLDIKPGSLIVLDQYIDRTKGNRESTFYKVIHIPQAQPFDEDVRRCLISACKTCDYEFKSSGTTVTIEGPRFSTKAESNLYKNWGASIVNMTTVPEASLAAEMGINYASLGLVTDYDCLLDDPEEEVNVPLVTKRMIDLREKAQMVLIEAVKQIEKLDWSVSHARKTRCALSSTMAK